MATIRTHQGDVPAYGGGAKVGVWTCRDDHSSWLEIDAVEAMGDGAAVVQISLDGLMELHTLLGELKRYFRPVANSLSNAQDRP